MSLYILLLLEFADRDECSDSTFNNCHINATCANTDGNFTCTCNDGYEGNGISCTGTPLGLDNDINENIGVCFL